MLMRRLPNKMLTAQQALVEPTRIGKVQGVMRGVTLGMANGMAQRPHYCKLKLVRCTGITCTPGCEWLWQHGLCWLLPSC